MSAPGTARVRREERRVAWANFLHGLFAPTGGVSQAEAARLTGAGVDKVGDWCSAEKSSQMPVTDVEALPEAIRIAIVERILGAGYRVVSTAPPQSLEDDLRVMSSIAEQSGQVVSHYARALADGNVSPQEAGEMRPRVVALVQQLETLLHDLDERIRDRAPRSLRVAGSR